MVVDLAQTAGVHTGWTMWGCGLRGRGRAEQSWEEARLREVSFCCGAFCLPCPAGDGLLYLSCFLALLGSTINPQSKLRQRKKEGRHPLASQGGEGSTGKGQP